MHSTHENGHFGAKESIISILAAAQNLKDCQPVAAAGYIPHVGIVVDKVVQTKLLAQLHLQAGKPVTGAQFGIVGLDSLETQIAQISDDAHDGRRQKHHP